MIIALFISIAAVVASFLWLQPEAAPQAAVADFEAPELLEASMSPAPTHEITPEADEPAADVEPTTQDIAPSPRVAPAATQQPASIVEHDEDCDGKEIHVERRDGEDVSIDVVCDKRVQGGGSVSNSVNIDATTGGEGSSGRVKVDLNISNTVGGSSTD